MDLLLFRGYNYGHSPHQDGKVSIGSFSTKWAEFPVSYYRRYKIPPQLISLYNLMELVVFKGKILVL